MKQIGRTKAQVLGAIKQYPIALKQCSTITSGDIVAFAQQLVSKVQPQTVANYLSHLSSIFAIAHAAWRYNLDYRAMGTLRS